MSFEGFLIVHQNGIKYDVETTGENLLDFIISPLSLSLIIFTFPHFARFIRVDSNNSRILSKVSSNFVSSVIKYILISIIWIYARRRQKYYEK